MDFRSLDKPPLASTAALPESPAPVTPPTPPEENQEIDVWWGGYAGRTMLPSFLLCGLLTVLIAAGAVYFLVRYDLPPLAVRYATYALIGSVWLCQLIRWGYRIAVLTYRLTTRRLFLDWSFFHAPGEVIELYHVTQVVVERNAWDRWTGVGRVRIVAPDHTLVLEGVRQPEHIAATIRVLVEQTKRPAPA